MGGPGSGRQRVVTNGDVEQAFALDIRILKVSRGVLRTGEVVWRQAGDVVGSLRYSLNTVDHPATRLSYVLNSTQRVDQSIQLTSTAAGYGGERFWFLCPSTGCGRRVRVVYLWTSSVHFMCRTCHRLTYGGARY
jgi:hypothetical protein